MRLSRHTLVALAALWLGALAGAAATFLTQVVQARVLGPADYGLFAAAWSGVSLAAPLAGLGLAPLWLRRYGEEGYQAHRWLPGSYRFAALSTALVTAGLLAWAAGGAPPGAGLVVAMLAGQVAAQLGLELAAARLQLEERYRTLAVLQAAPPWLRLGLLGGLLGLTGPAVSAPQVAGVWLVVALLTLGLTLVWAHPGALRRLQLRGHAPAAAPAAPVATPSGRAVARAAWPYGLGSLFYLIYFQSDILLLSLLVGTAAAGVYQVAFVALVGVYLLPTALVQKYLQPKLHRWAHHDRARFHQAYRASVRVLAGLGVLAGLALWGLAPPLIRLLFGDAYAAASDLLMVLACAVPFRFVATGMGAVLSTREHIHRKVRYMGLTAALNVALNLALIPAFAATGAAVATVISDLVLTWLYWRGLRRQVFPTPTPRGAR